MTEDEFSDNIHDLERLIRLYEIRQQDSKMKLRALRKERLKLLTARARRIRRLPTPLVK